MRAATPPQPSATIDTWALSYIESTDLRYKRTPPAPPAEFALPSLQIDPTKTIFPGRPPELVVTSEKPRNFKLGALERPEVRAALHHKFWHHELQAAELMCWAIVRFPETPSAFKKGLIRIIKDEIRHMSLYEEYLRGLGFSLSDFPVRDWFWERIPTCQNAVQFVALLGMGFEAANLEHTERFANSFRSLGDERAAQIQDQVGLEEVAHVKFATHWFRKWTGAVDFDTWCQSLPPPLSPLLLHGKVLQLERRRKADFPEEFLQRLAAWEPEW